MCQGKAETLSSEFESNTFLLPSLDKPKYIRMLKTYIHTHTRTPQPQIVSQSHLSHCFLSPLEQTLSLYINKTDFLFSSQSQVCRLNRSVSERVYHCHILALRGRNNSVQCFSVVLQMFFNKQPTPVFLPGKSHGQMGLMGYSPWGLRSPT